MVPPVLFYQDIREKKIFTFLFTLIQNEETGTGSRGVLPPRQHESPRIDLWKKRHRKISRIIQLRNVAAGIERRKTVTREEYIARERRELRRSIAKKDREWQAKKEIVNAAIAGMITFLSIIYGILYL